jgi:hypothetical protein
MTSDAAVLSRARNVSLTIDRWLRLFLAALKAKPCFLLGR